MIYHKSLSFKISSRFSLIIAFLILSIIFLSFFLVQYQIRLQQKKELNRAGQEIFLYFTMQKKQAPKIPYYIGYTVYSYNPKEESQPVILSTNDPNIPLLPLTEKKAQRYFKKDYFIDGNLDIYYIALSSSYLHKKIFSHSDVPFRDEFFIQVFVDMEVDTSSHIMGMIARVFLIIAIPLLFLSFLIAHLITLRTLKPVLKMTEDAAKIESASLDSRLFVSGSEDELDVLAKTFNALFLRLENDFKRERQFTSDVSHELKTPIAVIAGHANLLRRWGKDDPAQIEKSIASMIFEAKNMQSIVENLLELSKIESCGKKLVGEPFLVKEVCERLIEDTRVWASDVCIDFSKDSLFDEKLAIFAHKESFYEVLRILVSNSVRYAQEKPCIEIVIKKEADKRLSVSVIDNGIGISKEALNHIFERFYREDNARTRSEKGGSGLGLSIAKSLIEKMGGRIEAFSPPKNKRCGTELTISFAQFFGDFTTCDSAVTNSLCNLE